MGSDQSAAANFAATIDQADVEGPPTIVRVPRHDALPLSFSQERIWKACMSVELSAAYTMADCYRILGPLDVEVLRDCLTYLGRRHEILRTTFGVANEQLAATIHSPASVHLPIVDVSCEADPQIHARQLFKRETEKVFDLAKLPLLRFSLVRLGAEEHWLFRTNHEIISDGASWHTYFRELGILYEAWIHGRAPPLPEYEALQYIDFASWQRQIMRPPMLAYQQTLEWWKTRFERAPRCLELPLRRARPLAGLDPAEGTIAWGLDPENVRGLDKVRREEGATYFMSRLAVLAALIASETTEPDVILGTYDTHRTDVSMQNVIGFFSNPLSLRFCCDLDATFRDWLIVVRDAVMETAAHADLPYEELYRRLHGLRVPVPELLVFFEVNRAPGVERFAGLDLRRMEYPSRYMPWGLTVECDEQNERDGCRVKFDAGVYDPVGVREFIDHYRRLVGCTSSHPDLPLRELLGMSGVQPRQAHGLRRQSGS